MSHSIGAREESNLLAIQANGKESRENDDIYLLIKFRIETKSIKSFEEKGPTQSIKSF